MFGFGWPSAANGIGRSTARNAWMVRGIYGRLGDQREIESHLEEIENTLQKDIFSSLYPPTEKETHFSKDPNCVICRRMKFSRASCRRNLENRDGHLPRATNFSDMMTADHKIHNEEGKSRLQHRETVVVWLLNGPGVANVNPKLHKRPWTNYGSSFNREKSQQWKT